MLRICKLLTDRESTGKKIINKLKLINLSAIILAFHILKITNHMSVTNHKKQNNYWDAWKKGLWTPETSATMTDNKKILLGPWTS